MKNQREESIDFIKGLGIFLVVIGHSGFKYRNVIYLFHMALFFIASGYCYKFQPDVNIVWWIKKKLKALYIPNFVSVITVLLLNNILIDLHIVSETVYLRLSLVEFIKRFCKAICFGGGDQLLGANWFFRTLFFGILMYELVNRILPDRWNIFITRLIIYMAALIGGWLLTLNFGHGMYFNILSVPILLEIGYLFKSFNIFNKFMNKQLSVIYMIGALLILLLLSLFGTITLNYNVITNPIFFLLCSIIGFCLSVSIYKLCIQLSKLVILTFNYLGRNSIWIMMLHFISFKFIALLQIGFYGDGIEKLASHPVYISSGGWWVVYSIAGICIPILVMVLFRKGSILFNQYLIRN
ncbi:MAG: acyltransferase family protein [Lachnospiraceae bacterium]|nr:acyltransferase family protein [Lachnospiraceae bacterium]